MCSNDSYPTSACEHPVAGGVCVRPTGHPGLHTSRVYAVPQDERECTCASNRRSRECEMHGDHARDSRRGTLSHRDIVDAQRRSFGEDGTDASEGRAALDALAAERAGDCTHGTPYSPRGCARCRAEAAENDAHDWMDRAVRAEAALAEVRAMHKGARIRYRQAERELAAYKPVIEAVRVEFDDGRVLPLSVAAAFGEARAATSLRRLDDAR
jgi:hypothetical protein